MEISIPLNMDDVIVIDHNVTDTTREYYTGNGVDSIVEPYGDEEVLQDNDKLYEYISLDGTPFTPPPWVLADEGNYAIGDVLYKDHYNVITTSVGTVDGAQQPENGVFDTTWTLDAWTRRYTRLFTAYPGSIGSSIFTNIAVGSELHSLYYVGSQSSTLYLYKVQYEITVYTWSNWLYQYGSSYVAYYPAGHIMQIFWKGSGKYTASASLPLPYGTVFHGDDGLDYKNGAGQYTDIDGNIYYEVSQSNPSQETAFKYEEATVSHESRLDTYENTAYSFGSPTTSRWVGRHFIIRGTELYMRTNVDVSQTIIPIVSNLYETIPTLEQFPNFAEVGVVNYKKPFDGKKYTKVSQEASSTPVRYLLETTTSEFDTLAIAGLIANNIEVIFRLPNDDIASHIASYVPDTNRDINNVLSPYPTTAVLYSTADEQLPIGSTIEILLSGPTVEIATLLLGLSVNAGFTNMAFSTKFVDRSPKEVDQWGNVVYVTEDKYGNPVNVKTLTWNGTVDVLTTNFDMTTRLMVSMGAITLILNGSDSKDNVPPDNSNNVFASTMLIGRLKDFNLKTKIADDDLDVMCTYSLTIEEDV